MVIEYVEQHAELGLVKLIPEYWGRPRIGAWLAAYLRQAQVYEDTIWDVLAIRTIDQGDDYRLNVIGALIGQPRHGFETELYRRVLRARALANRSQGTGADLSRVLTALFGDAADFGFLWVQGAVIWIASLVDTDSELARAAQAVLPHARAAGVQLQLLYTEDISAASIYGDNWSDSTAWATVRVC